MVGETNSALTGLCRQGDSKVPEKYILQSAKLLDECLNKTAAEIYVYSDAYKQLLLKDYEALPVDDPSAADALFGRCAFSLRLAHSLLAQIKAWEYVLGLNGGA